MRHLLLVGASHHTAPVEVRERLTFAAERMGTAIADLRRFSGFTEAVVLSTCNRSEVYAVSQGPEKHYAGEYDALRNWYAGLHSIAAAEIEPYLYLHQNREAVRHLFRVASGLDSLLLGEAEILGQVREAYRAAVADGSTGPVLNRLFQGGLEAGKRVRTQTDIGSRPMSVALAGVKLAERVFGKLTGRQALVLGAGAMAEQVAEHMRNRGLGRLLVASRSSQRGAELAARFGGWAVPWGQLEEVLAEAEIVVSSVGGQERILTREMLGRVMKARANRELFLIDLGVPRNVEPAGRELYNVYLYDLEDLSSIVEQNRKARQDEIPRAEAIVSEHVAKFQMWMAGAEIIELVLALRERVRHERESILHEQLKQLVGLSPEARRKAVQHLQALIDRTLQEPGMAWEESDMLRGDAPELREVRELIALAGEKP